MSTFADQWYSLNKYDQSRLFQNLCLNGEWDLLHWCASHPDFEPNITRRTMSDIARRGRCDVLAWLFDRYRIPFNTRKAQRDVYDAILLAAAEVGSLECMKLAADPRHYPNTPIVTDWGAKNFDQALDVVVDCDECVEFLLDAKERSREYLDDAERSHLEYEDYRRTLPPDRLHDKRIRLADRQAAAQQRLM